MAELPRQSSGRRRFRWWRHSPIDDRLGPEAILREATRVAAITTTVELGDGDWSSVLYALDCFGSGACGHDHRLPAPRALWLGSRIRDQLARR